MSYQHKEQEQEEEPPSYDHALQAGLSPENAVCQYGKFQDASYDSFARGEEFIQALKHRIDSFPKTLAEQIASKGLVHVLSMDANAQTNILFRHPRATPASPALTVTGQDVSFWPHRPRPFVGEDWDVTCQATHPFLSLTECGGPSLPSVHYFEVTVLACGPEVVLAVGLTTQPYPLFRLPGWNRYSVGYHSDDGHKFCDDATGGQAYGPHWGQGDTVGCGFEPEQGNVFYTLNGHRIDDAYRGLEKHFYFASLGADGPATVRMNFGQTPFLYAIGDVWAGTKV